MRNLLDRFDRLPALVWASGIYLFSLSTMAAGAAVLAIAIHALKGA